jgi:hypothetical protein
MTAQDDLAAAVTALGTETSEREGKVSAVRDAAAAVSTALDGLKAALDALDGAAPAVPDQPADVLVDQPVDSAPVTSADVPEELDQP